MESDNRSLIAASSLTKRVFAALRMRWASVIEKWRTVSAKHAASGGMPKHMKREDAVEHVSTHAPRHARPDEEVVASPTSSRTVIIAMLAAFMAVAVAVLTLTNQVRPIDNTSTALADTSDSIVFSQRAFENTTSWEQVEGFLGVLEDGLPLNADAAFNMADYPMDFTSHVASVLQNETMMGGCEPVSLAMLLNSMGFGVDAKALVDKYLVIDGKFTTGYSGSPYLAGGGYPPGLVKAANAYLAEQGSPYVAHDLSGTSFDGIARIVQSGRPVMVWSTLYLEEPLFSGSFQDGVEWYNNEHCVLVFGVDDTSVMVADPLEGFVVRDRAAFAEVYAACGSMAAYVR